MASVSKRLATDETLMLLVDTVNNTETVKQAKAEIQAEGTAQVNNVRSTAEEMVKDINQVPKNTSDIAELNSNLDTLAYSENSINGNIVNGTNLIGTAVREGSFALSDSVVIPSGSNTISTVYFTDGTKSTLNFSFSDGSVALPNPTTSDFTVSHVYFNSVHVGKIIKNIQLEIGTTSKGELYYVSSNNKLTKEIHKLNDSLGDYGFNNKTTPLKQGGYTSEDGTYKNFSYWVCTSEMIPCKKGDTITIKSQYGKTHEYIMVRYYDASKQFVGTTWNHESNTYTTTCSFDNVAYCNVNFQSSDLKNITPSEVVASIYVNNAIDNLKNDLVPKKIELQNVDERVTIKDNGSFIINGFAFVNLLVTFKETLPQWSNFVRLPRPKNGTMSVYCENSVEFTIYSQDNLPGDCGTDDIVQSGTEVRLLVNYEVA